MSPEERLAQLRAEATTLRAKANTADFNEADAARASAIAKEFADLEAIVARKAAVDKSFAGIDGTVQDNSSEDPSAGSRGAMRRKSGKAAQVPAGDAAAEFTRNVMDAFKAAAPTIGGPFAQKALIPAGAVSAGFSGIIVSDPRNSFSLYELVQHADAEGKNGGNYLRQTVRTNNAAGVKDGDLKPISVYGLEQKNWRLATIAHLSEPMQRQWFQDYEGLQQFVTTELAYGIDLAIADMILNGGTDEDGATFTGILNTTGIGQTAYAGSAAASIRRAITELQSTGAVPTHVVLNPLTWEAIEQTMNANQDYVLGSAALTEHVTPRLNGLPVVLSPAMPADEAVVGDLGSIVAIDSGDLMLAWSEGGSVNVGTEAVPDNVELFRANKLVWRAEMRMGLQIMSTKTIRVATLTGA